MSNRLPYNLQNLYISDGEFDKLDFNQRVELYLKHINDISEDFIDQYIETYPRDVSLTNLYQARVSFLIAKNKILINELSSLNTLIKYTIRIISAICLLFIFLSRL